MKGFVSTSTFLKAILDKSLSLRGKGLMSHLALFEVPTYHKIIGVTDGGMIIAPDLEQKVQIIEMLCRFLMRCITSKSRLLFSALKKGRIPTCLHLGCCSFENDE